MDPRTVQLQVVASLNNSSGAPTLDGTSRGAMTVRIPQGWRVDVTFVNHSTAGPDGLAVTPASLSGPTPFSGASVSSVPPSGVAYFHFNASRQGRFALASTSPRRAAAGEWLRLEVGPSSSLPELVLKGETFALNVTGRRG